jgi:hypothetical protein
VRDTKSIGRMLPTREVCRRYDVCTRTIERWVQSETLNFPQPAIINKRKYFPESELIDWDRSRARMQAQKNCASQNSEIVRSVGARMEAVVL